MAYLLARNGRPYGDPLSATRLVREVRSNAKRIGPRHRLQPPKTEWSNAWRLPWFTVQLIGTLRAADIGQITRVAHGTQRHTGEVVFLVKKVKSERHGTLLYYTGQPVNLAEGNRRIAEAGQWAVDTEPRIRCNGYAYTRRVEGLPDVWSQHSRFEEGCNGIDLKIYTDSGGVDTEVMDRFARKLQTECQAGGLQLRRFMWNGKDYRRDHGWAPIPIPSGANPHNDHLHAEGEPYQAGTPVDAT